MKTRLLFGLALAVLVASLAFSFNRKGQDPVGTVDGAKNPSAIPDIVAYEMFFNSLIPQKELGGNAEGAVLAKLNQIGISESDQGTLRFYVEDFKGRLNGLDGQVDAMREENLQPSSAATLAKLNELQAQKRTLIESSISLVRQKLSAEGAEKVTKYINDYVRQRIKIVPPSHH